MSGEGLEIFARYPNLASEFQLTEQPCCRFRNMESDASRVHRLRLRCRHDIKREHSALPVLVCIRGLPGTREKTRANTPNLSLSRRVSNRVKDSRRNCSFAVARTATFEFAANLRMAVLQCCQHWKIAAAAAVAAQNNNLCELRL